MRPRKTFKLVIVYWSAIYFFSHAIWLILFSSSSFTFHYLYFNVGKRLLSGYVLYCNLEYKLTKSGETMIKERGQWILISLWLEIKYVLNEMICKDYIDDILYQISRQMLLEIQQKIHATKSVMIQCFIQCAIVINAMWKVQKRKKWYHFLNLINGIENDVIKL